MKSAVLSLGFAAGVAVAQLGDGVPKCAVPCINEYTTGDKVAGCNQLDIKCICSNSDFLDNIACCLQDSCDDAGKDAAVKFAAQICSSVGVDAPDKVECKSSSSPSSTGSSEGSSSSASASGSGASASSSASSSEETGSAASTTEGSSEGTDAPGAAAEVSKGFGSVVGAAVAMLFAL